MVATLDYLFFAALLEASRGFIHLLSQRVLVFTEDALRRPRNDPSGATGSGRPSNDYWGQIFYTVSGRII